MYYKKKLYLFLYSRALGIYSFSIYVEDGSII